MIFAGMSGSAVADAAGLGVIEIRAMIKEGYTAAIAATISAVSATIGPIIPPSIPFVIYGSLANVSVGALFLAGILPGLLMGLGLMGAIAIAARRLDLPRSAGWPSARVALHTVLRAAPALALPPVILVVIFTGVATPTEAAVVAAAFAFALGRFVYRELTLADFWQTLWESGRQTAQVMLIIAMSAPFGWVLIQQQVPNAILKSLMSLSSEPWVILLIVNAVLLILGMFLEAIAIMIIAYPILPPVMAAIGVDPVHFGVIMVLNLMIGLVTPPVGLCLYVVSGIAKVPIADIVSELGALPAGAHRRAVAGDLCARGVGVAAPCAGLRVGAMIVDLLSSIDRFLARACRWIVQACFLGLFVLLSLGIAQRVVPADEGARLRRAGRAAVHLDDVHRRAGAVARKRAVPGRRLRAHPAGPRAAGSGRGDPSGHAGGRRDPVLRGLGFPAPVGRDHAVPADRQGLVVCGDPGLRHADGVYSIVGAWRALRGDIKVRHGIATLG